jgi:alkyl hydroperoxide reductase subunit AhpF
MLDGNLKTQLQTYLQRVTAPVELVAASAGDVTTVPYKQIIIAMGDGRWARRRRSAPSTT